MKRHHLILIILPLILLCAGCEPDDDEVRGELPVTPATTTLTGDEKTVILTADVSIGDTNPEPIVYPLEWSVSDSSMGSIVAQSADKATYTHTSRGTGGNTIMVRDGLAREGLATVFWDSSIANAPSIANDTGQ
ncbi:hypothetical protein [Kiritimatiella glycovorans]|uniref:Uncharacterized protein n=1 Tax=Kiritimatiella glycovorans TaxID=1307763 RepID=A0A0G3EJ77_9BACT|nr:hypothetical protein [Kiritimatiella glycovorans]AKJ64830.1 hypothetical protein L21SP4_01587 [Kiritimatiella glycovorans]